MFLKFFKYLMIGALTVCWAAPAASAATPEEIVKAIQERHADMTAFGADYVRTTKTPAMDGLFQSSSTHTASGFLIFKKPARLLLNQAQPRTEKLVTDGSTVWWYIPDENVVHRYNNVSLSGDLQSILDFFNGLGSLEGRYRVRVFEAGTDGETRHRLELSRLFESDSPQDITVWFNADDYLLAGFRLTSLTGETTEFTLTEVKVNPEAGDDIFLFRIPPGTDVLDEGGAE